ncbi:MAG: peptidoglycan bridge formation glycyltransferase FemA/FemB family protein [Chloroflexi bacterium]|nr:peptidoglycan bridge formation glycyltransferase FemA/FemB family protein [Chloroflexota bacterium]
MHLHGARAPRRAGEAGRAGRGSLRLTDARLATSFEEASWDDLVLATNRAHILQTKGWAEAKALGGWRAERYVLGDGGVAQVLLKPLRFGLTMAYCPRGPLAVGSIADAIAALRVALRRHRCVALLCDPEVPETDSVLDALRAAGVRRSPVYVQPRRTLLMNPEIGPEVLMASMRKKTRQYIRKAERAGVVTEETDDLERFHRVLRIVGERDRFAVHSLEYFERLRSGLGGRLHVLVARIGDEDVGALMLARMAERAWELYGGWSGTHAGERPFYLLKWRAIQRMRQLGVGRYDMWGLSETADDPLAGVTEFKLGFGGDVVEWIGALETPVTRWLYPVWRLFGRRRLARSA